MKHFASLKVAIIVLILMGFVLLADIEPVSSAPQAQGTSGGRAFQTGDVLVSILDSSYVKWYSSSGVWVGDILNEDGTAAGLAFDSERRRLYLTTRNNVSIYNEYGVYLERFGGAYEEPVSVLFDRDGNVYVGQVGISVFLRSFDASGALIKSFLLSGYADGAEWIDLASDQCTLYYTSSWSSEGVKRYNVCSSTEITPNLTKGLNLSEKVRGIRLLPDGSLLVAATNDIRRLDVDTGEETDIYDVSGENDWSHIALSPDGNSFWAASGGTVYKIDIDTENVSTEIFVDSYSRIDGLAVIGEFAAVQITPTFTPTFTSTSTDTPTPTLTRMPTFMPTGTITKLSTETEVPTRTEEPVQVITATPTPIPASQETRLSIPWEYIFVAVPIIGGAYIAVRKLRSRPSKVEEPSPHYARVTVRIHEDPGTQVVEPASNVQMPELRVRLVRGQADVFVVDGDSVEDKENRVW